MTLRRLPLEHAIIPSSHHAIIPSRDHPIPPPHPAAAQVKLRMLDFNLKEVNFKSAWQSSEAIVGRIPILQIPARQSLKFELTDLSFTVSIVSIVSIVS